MIMRRFFPVMIRCLAKCRPSASHGASLSLHGLHVCISLLELTPGAPEPNARGAAPSTSAYSCAPLAQTRNLHGRLHWAAALPSPRDRQRALADEERAEGGGRDHGAPGRPDGRPLRPRERRAKVLAELGSAAVGLSSSCICPGNVRGSGALSARCPSSVCALQGVLRRGRGRVPQVVCKARRGRCCCPVMCARSSFPLPSSRMGSPAANPASSSSSSRLPLLCLPPCAGVKSQTFVHPESLLRRLFERLSHPDPYQRLGGATALYHCYR